MTAPVNRIAEMRKQAGLTQQALADKLGIHWVTVSKIERGNIKLTFERCKQIASALGVSERVLIYTDDPNERIKRPWKAQIATDDRALDITRGEKVSFVWGNMSRREKKISEALDAENTHEAIGLLLGHVSTLKKVVIAQSYCNDHLLERIEALEAKVNRAPNKDAAEMRKAASMLYARAKQLEGE